jgi:anionic cell wall polymer biosynthesis LytR-Cps2A-Psr (LCP) family protein
MRKTKSNASIFLLVLIAMFLAGGITLAILAFRSDPIGESLSGDQVINTMFVIENQGKALCTYVLMYYPPTRRAAIFDIPGSLGLIIRRINRVDRIDTLYDFQRLSPFQNEVERLLGVDIAYSVILTLENLGKIVDLIEGVDIFIPVPVDFYQDEAVLFPSGVTRLDGDKVRTFITYELPHENSDMGVHRRQRFFLSFLKRLGEKNESLKNPQTGELYQSFLKTNLNTRTRVRLFDAIAHIDTDRVNIQSVSGNLREVSGQILIFPHWDGNLIKDIVRQSLSSMVRQMEGSLDDRVFTVEVLNGTTVSGLAGRTAELLRGFGYDIISIGNADRHDYQRSFIIDRSGQEEIARTFGDIIRCRDVRVDTSVDVGSDLDMDLRNYEYRADFTLILGKDFNERYVTGN